MDPRRDPAEQKHAPDPNGLGADIRYPTCRLHGPLFITITMDECNEIAR